jgi:hypothetical protein
MAALDAILQQHPVWRGGSLARPISVLPTGFTALEAELPGGGLPFPDLSVRVIGGEHSAFFKSIGVATLGELLALPREGLAQRCGQGLINELDRALGKLPEPREFFAPPERFNARLELPAEVSHAEALLFGARRLLVQLEGLLAARQAYSGR